MTNFMYSNAANRTIGDRFIPNRINSNFEVAHFNLISSGKHITEPNTDIFNLKSQKLHQYRELLEVTLNYHNSPIFSFRNKPNITKKKDKKEPTKIYSQWPCLPRKHPILYKPDIILDWPVNNPKIYWNIVDWGSNGYMATIWSRKVYLWRNQSAEEVKETSINAYGALKWNHAGTKLAVAGFLGILSVWSFPEEKEMFRVKCDIDIYGLCTISCIAWDLTDSLLISGCSKGSLFAWNSKGTSVEQVEGHPGYRIISLAFCASNKYVCSSATDGMVRIWFWPSLEAHVEINHTSPVRALAFHPWRPSILAVGGGVDDGSLSLWNVTTCRRLGYFMPEYNSIVDCLTWNKISGELVSSHRIFSDRENDFQTKVLVLASFNRVVDSMDDHHGRVLYLMWDKTGSKLATACTDETLCIWNFLSNLPKNNEAVVNRTRIYEPRQNGILSTFEKCIR